MASNFLNSAGTDLDDVFFVNNSNAGALGFQVSNGQDLGNRYPSGSMGYNVGYQNSAGTDIGYLRSDYFIPVVTSHNVTGSNVYSGKDGCYGPVERCYDNDTGWYDCYSSMRTRHNKGYVTVNGACSAGRRDVSWEIRVYYRHDETAYSPHYITWNMWANTTNIPSVPYPHPKASHIPTCPKSLNLNVAHANQDSSSYYTILSNSYGSQSRSFTFSYYLAIQDKDGRNGSLNQYLRVYQRFYNNLGSSPWVYNDFHMGYFP
jgi:hypothetical protein